MQKFTITFSGKTLKIELNGLLISQKVPAYPATQLQVNEDPEREHPPPFRQGAVEHGSTGGPKTILHLKG